MSSSGSDVGISKFITPKEAAATLGVSVAAIYSRIESGALVAVKLHTKKKCRAGCRCPLRLPILAFSAYLAYIHELS